MCVVSYRNNFIFYHIPKCGGTSISEIIYPKTNTVKNINHTHLTYLETKEVFKKNGMLNWFENANQFAIVRNPKDRMMSFFKYIKQHTNHHLNQRLINHTFTQFCYFSKNVGDKGIQSCFNHLMNEYGIIDKNIKIVKLENIDSNINILENITGISFPKNIPISNKSDFKIENTIESDMVIKLFLKDDYVNFYPELL